MTAQTLATLELCRRREACEAEFAEVNGRGAYGYKASTPECFLYTVADFEGLEDYTTEVSDSDVAFYYKSCLPGDSFVVGETRQIPLILLRSFSTIST